MFKRARALWFLLATIIPAVAQEPAPSPTPTATASPPSQQQAQVVEATITNSVRLPYLLYLPQDYAKSDAKWPLLIYLHGGSLRGGDIERLRNVGLTRRLESEPNFPFIVVSPHCVEGEIWTGVGALGALLDRMVREYRVDPNRIYITGHSMGGRGALYFAYRLPDRFAAVVAISAVSPITSWGSALARMPVWILHGTADTLAPIAEVKDLVKAIEKADGHVRFDAIEGRDHSILEIYNQPEVFDWLAQQKRAGPK